MIFNFRAYQGINKGINAKSIALFISGKVKLNNLERIQKLVNLLLSLRSKNSKYLAWGYYFPWQSRVFYLPSDTPNIVVTSFTLNAFMDLYGITHSSLLLESVENSINFLVKELNIYQDHSGICFSYSPYDKSIIYNASAMGLEVILRYLSLTDNSVNELETIVEKGVRFIKNAQNSDGSWYYGKQPIQHFIDHYHTAYILESLENMDRYTNQSYNLKPYIEHGLKFYLENMFTKEIVPKYYKSATYPIESHCAGAAIKALCVLSERFGKELFNKAIRIAQWSIDNLYDGKKGYFYYQKRNFWTNKINYLRWSQAWMFIGLSYLVKYAKKYGYSVD